jgi:hypothetical protein
MKFTLMVFKLNSSKIGREKTKFRADSTKLETPEEALKCLLCDEPSLKARNALERKLLFATFGLGKWQARGRWVHFCFDFKAAKLGRCGTFIGPNGAY